MKKTSTLRNDTFELSSHSSLNSSLRRNFKPIQLIQTLFDQMRRLIVSSQPPQCNESSVAASFSAVRTFTPNETKSSTHQLKPQNSQPMRQLYNRMQQAIHSLELLNRRVNQPTESQRTRCLDDGSSGWKIPKTFSTWSKVVLSSILMLFILSFNAHGQAAIAPGTPDLKVKKTIDKSTVAINDIVTYTIVVKNEGNGAATGVELTDQLPAGGASYQSHTVITGANAFNTASGVWTIGTLAAGAEVKMELKAKVTAEGVWFNIAQITKQTEKDDDSTPNNNVITEDDYDAACFSVPITYYPGDEFTVSIPSGYNGVQWFKNEQLVTAQTSGVTLNQDGSLTIKSPGTYRFTTVLANCPQGSCCPIQVVQGPYGSIGDYVWKDLNKNGLQDGSEVGVQGISVELYKTDANGNPQGGPIKTTVTDANGAYKFEQLLLGSYKVKFIVPNNMDMSLTQKDAGDDTKDSDAGTDGFSPKIDINPFGSGIAKDNPTIDAGLIQNYGSIGDYVWKDLNNNGLQDGGEPSVPGITVELYKTDANGTTQGAAFKTTTTDANGAYKFDLLASGDYKVKFIIPTNMDMVLTTPNAGDDTKDSDVNPGDGFSPKVTINANGTGIDKDNPTIDAGLITNFGSIGDYVWKDLNSNGLQDGGEVGVPGITVELYKTDASGNVQGAAFKTTTTDANGYYRFDQLASGDYKVKFIVPGNMDMSLTQKDAGDDTKDSDAGTDGFSPKVTIDANGTGIAKNNPTIDAGLIQNYGSIGDYVWKDLNNNGLQDGGEPGVPGITVELYKTDANGTPQGAAIKTTTTDASGAYKFDLLASGDYKVKFIIPTNMDMILTTPNAGDDTKDSDAGTDGFSPKVTVDANGTGIAKNNPTIDAGLITNFGSIGDYVWKDLNGNGLQDSGEVGVPGIIVELYKTDPTGTIITSVPLATVTTDANGYYLFDKLASGDYKVKFVIPSSMTGMAFTDPDKGDDTKDSDAGTGGFTPKITINANGTGIEKNNTTIDAGIKNTCVPPSIQVSANKSICVGESAPLIGTSTGNLIRWYYAAVGGSIISTSASGEAFIVSPTTTTTYYAEAVVPNQDNCVGQRVPVTVVVNAKPVTPVCTGNTSNVCPSTTVDLTKLEVPPASTPGGIYEWHVGASPNSALVTDPTKATAGTYYLFEKSTAGCFSNPALVTVNIVDCACQNPTTADAGADQTLCEGATVLLSGKFGGSASSATWTSSGTGTFANASSLNTSYTPSSADIATGTITIKLTTNDPDGDKLCTPAVDALIVKINKTPEAPYQLACDTLICLGESTKLFALSPGNTIKWYTQAQGGVAIGTALSGGNLVVTPTANTTYYAESISPSGCASKERTPISVKVKKCYADLAVIKTVLTPGPYTVGQTITYSVEVKNLGPVTASEVTVDDVLPSSLTFVNSAPPGQYNNSTGVWTVGLMAPTSSKTLLITATINKGGTITNTAIVKSPDNDPTKPENDKSTVTIEVPQYADLSLSKDASNKTPNVGEQVTYTLVVKNDGPLTATNVEVTDYLPAGVSFVSSSNMTLSGSVVKATIPSIASGGSVSLSFIVKVTGEGSITNKAEITKSDQKDPDSTPGNGTGKGEDDEASVDIRSIKPCNLEPPVVACGKTTICVGESVGLTASGCTGTVVWSTGATGATLSVTPSSTTTYTAYCKDGNCTSADSKPMVITVIKVTPPVLSCGKSTICLGESAIITAEGCTGGTVTWSTGAVGTSLTVTPSATTTYTATCKIENCVSDPSVGHTITVIKVTPPVISCTTTTICKGQSATLKAEGCAGTITWSTGATGASLTVTPEATTTYWATCKVENCVSGKSNEVTVTVGTSGTPPVVTCGKGTLCLGESVVLTAAGCTGTVIWSTGATGTSITVTPTVSTGYTATCKVGECTSGPSNVENIVVIKVTAPVISCAKETICPGESVVLSASGCEGGVITWSTGATGIAITVTPSATTTYTATCKIAECVSSPGSKTITVTKPEPPVITCSNETICLGQNATLTAAGCTGGTVTWSTGATGVSITVSPSATTSYTATCKIGECVSAVSAPKTITIITVTPPVVTCSSDTICLGQSSTLTATGCAGTVTWSTGATGASITVSPTTNTSYTATCKVENCVSGPSAARTIVVISVTPPVITCAYDQICPGKSVTLSAAGCEGGIISWSTGATGLAITVTPTTTTTYTAICKIGKCVSAVASKTISVAPIAPPIVMASTETICVGQSATLMALGCSGTVTWSNGATGPQITVSPAATTSYSATCQVGECLSPISAIRTITVISVTPPTVTCSSDTICAGDKSILTAAGCTGTVTWSNGATGTSITVSPVTTTSYTATCKIGDCVSGPSVVRTIFVISVTPPVITCANDQICPGQSVTLSATGCEGGTIVWSTGATGLAITVTPSATTTYSAICKKGKCVSEAGTKTITVTTVAPPTVVCSNETICLGQSATLTASGCAGTVTWSTGATGATLTVSPTATTSYTATCKVGDCVSAASTAKTITVITVTPPVITLNKESICLGESATLTATGCAGTVTWSTGATGASITVSPTTTTSYTATCKVAECVSGLSVAKTITVIVVTPPVITCSNDVICAGTSVTLSATGCEGTVVWSSGQTGTSIIVSPSSTTSYNAVCKVGTCTSLISNTKTVQVKNPVIPVISASNTTICKGGDVTLKAVGCEGTVVWSNGMTGNQITVSLSATTTFSASCTIDKCTSPASDKITVSTVMPSVPVITCSTGSICPGESVVFSALGCEGTVEWSTGAKGATLTVSPTVTTTYSAICVVGECKSPASAIATINVGNPAAPFIYCELTSVCAGSSATLKSRGCDGTVVWSNGMSGNTITVAPATTTGYTAICKGKSCESTVSNTVTIAVGAPIAKPKTSDLMNTCPLITVNLASGVSGSVSTTGGVFEFRTGATPSSALVATPNTVGNGTYFVFEKTATGCYSEGSVINVVIKNCNTTPICSTTPATADAGADATVCADAGIKLAGKIGGAATAGKWTSSGTGTFDNSGSLTATYKPSIADITAGKVKIALTTDDPDGAGDCKAATDTLVLTVKGITVKPAITFTGSNNRCTGDSVTLTANEGYNYKWSTGATTRSITVKASGNYSVNLMGADGCGSVSSDAVAINFASPIAAPAVNTPKSNVCPSTTVDLTTMVTSLPGTGGSFQFNITNNPNSAVIVNPKAVGAGNYYVFEKSEIGCFSAPAALKVNIINCSTDSTADLSIKKIADKSKVAVGSNVTYTLKVKNFGPKAATNVEVKDVLPTGLEFVSGEKFTNVNGNLTAKVNSLAVGDSVSLSFVAKVTSTGKIINTASISKMDQFDPASSDNTGSVAINDTTYFAGEGQLGLAKSVSAAKVKDNVYDLTYTFTVSNIGGGTLAKVQVSDTLSKVFAGGATYTKPILTADAGFVIDTTYTGAGSKVGLLVDTLSNLPAGVTRKITLKTTVDVSNANSTSFNNIALAKATVPASGGTPAKPVDDTSVPGDKVDPNNNGNPKDDTGSTPINLPKVEVPKAQLGLALAVIDTVKQANGSYNVTYKATLRNLGTVALSKVQVIDSLSKVFASPVTFTLVGKPSTRSGSSLVVDTTFNGSTKVNILTDSSKLAVGVLDSVRFTVNVVLGGQKGPFNNQALGRATAPDGSIVTDLSNNGIDPTAAGTASTPLIFGLPNTRIGVSKTAGTPLRVGTTGRIYEIPYEIRVTNFGATDVTKVSVKDDLAQVFTAKGAVLSNDKIIVTADAGFVVNKNYTGVGLNTELLVADSSSLPKGETRKVSFKVKVDFSSSTDSVFNNVAMGKGTAANGASSEDASQSGSNPDPDNNQNPSDNNVPTPVTVPNVVTPKVSIGLAMAVSDTIRQQNGSFNVTYKIVVKNYGTEILKNIQVTDSLSKTFTSPTTYSVVGAPKVNAGSNLKVNNAFNGTTDSKLLDAATSTLAIGATDTIRLTINVVHDGRTTAYQARSYGQATGNDVTKLVFDTSASGLNPDKNSNGNPSDPGEDDVTSLLLPAGLQELFIPEGFSPNNDGINDLFVIRNTKGATINLQVFNRWGSVIYTSEDYKNDWSGEGNSGVRLGSGGVPDGTYYYIVKLSDGREFIRFFTISR